MQTLLPLTSSGLPGSGFIRMSAGNNFLLTYSNTAGQNAIVVLPPFAEEMNKSRHLLSAVMRQLSALGYCCFLPDHYGTGDSEGDLDQASIGLWRADLLQLIQLLAQRGYQSLSFIAVRFGTLQLFDLLNLHTLPLPVKQLVLWQPLFDVDKFWQQFVRIKVAETMATGNKVSQKELEQQLQDGQQIEIAGYPLSPAFFASLQTLQGAIPPLLSHTPVCWLETSQLDNIALPVQKMRDTLQQCCQLSFVQLKAEPYWQTTELASAEQLLALTVQQFSGAAQHE